MLKYGYAKKKSWFSFANLMLLSNWLCAAVWVIVGKADPNKLPVTPVVDGNATPAASLSVAAAVSFWKAVSEPLWDMIGMPHDMGTSDAHDGSTAMAIAMHVRITMTDIVLIELPSSIYLNIGHLH